VEYYELLSKNPPTIFDHIAFLLGLCEALVRAFLEGIGQYEKV
jgi:hypothetical protein